MVEVTGRLLADGLRRTSLQMGYLKKNGDGSLLYSVVNVAEPDADGGWPLARLGLLWAAPHAFKFCSRTMILNPCNLLRVPVSRGVRDAGCGVQMGSPAWLPAPAQPP